MMHLLTNLNARPLAPPLFDQATCFVNRNYFDKWLWPRASQLKMENHVATLSAVRALGLAALSNIRLSPTMMAAAREQYTIALGSTSEDLRDPVRSKEDHTLMAVILMGMFEVRP